VPTQYAAHITIVTPAGHMLAGAICNSGCLMQDNMDAKTATLPAKLRASKQARE